MVGRSEGEEEGREDETSVGLQQTLRGGRAGGGKAEGSVCDERGEGGGERVGEGGVGRGESFE